MIGYLAQAAQRLHVRSALNPMLWLVGICSASFLPAAYNFREIPWMCALLIAVPVFVVVCACIAYAFFACRNPEKLQSEEYQIRHESLQLIQQKSGSILINPTTLEAITNPELKQLPQGERK